MLRRRCLSLTIIVLIILAGCHRGPALGEPFTLEGEAVRIGGTGLAIEMDKISHSHDETGRGSVHVFLIATLEDVSKPMVLEPGEEAEIGEYRIQLLRAVFAVGSSSCELLVTRQ